MEIVLVVLLILGVLLSMIIGMPMRRHLLEHTHIKKIGLFQMPFYMKDYQKMIVDSEDLARKKKFQAYLSIYLLANLIFIIAALILLLQPEMSA
jgi:hypothetical protein